MAPKARDDLLLSPLEDELLVYDLRTARASCLNATVRAVFERCDGRTTPEQIASIVGTRLVTSVPTEIVRMALQELADADLLEIPMPDLVSRSRRRAMRQLTVMVGTSLALPAIWSVVAPTQAQAASSIMCIPASDCMGTSSTTCCGTSGGAAMACSGGAGMCMGTSTTCTGTCS